MTSQLNVDVIVAESATSVTVNDALVVAEGITVTASGVTVTAGGITVTSGGLTVTAGGATITSGGLTVTAGTAQFNDNVILGASSADTITANGTMVSNLIFTDATYDIGAAAATRPRDIHLSRNAVVGSTIELGHATDTTLSRTAAGRVAIETLGIVKGPASSVDNTVPRFDSTTGELIQGSSVTVADSSEFNLYPATTGSSSWARKNAIIGGDFSTNPWQRGTSFTSIADTVFCADRWSYHKVGAAVHDATRSTDAPTVAQAGRLTNHCLMLDCTTVDASIAAGDYSFIQQKIEGYNFLPLAQKAMTLSFWHKHTKTGTYCVGLRNSGVDRSYVIEYTQDVTDTWEFASATITASPSAGTWDYTTGLGIGLVFPVAAGSTFQTTANAWQTGNFIATANQVNGADNTANNFRIALVQLEAGSVATEFESRTVQEELALCQRYYLKSYAQGTYAGTATADGASGGVAIDTTVIPSSGTRFRVVMRATPTVTLYSGNGTSGVWTTWAGANIAASAATNIVDGGFLYVLSSGLSAGAGYYGQWIAVAEL